MAAVPIEFRQQVLVTRPRAEAETLAAGLGERGLVPVIAPVIEIDLRTDAMLDLGGVQAVLCTSANGVRALARLSAERRLPVFAVGEVTAKRARAEGFVEVAAARGDVGDLARLVAARLRPCKGRLLHAAGSDVAGDLAGTLRRHGFTVERATLYEARPVAALAAPAVAALCAGSVAFALFFSPRSAAIFARLATAGGVAGCCRSVVALSISAAADAAAGELAWKVRCVAQRPTQSALLEALDVLLGEGTACRPIDRKEAP
jgi:uroporphyrinogen-III synthase